MSSAKNKMFFYLNVLKWVFCRNLKHTGRYWIKKIISVYPFLQEEDFACRATTIPPQAQMS